MEACSAVSLQHSGFYRASNQHAALCFPEFLCPPCALTLWDTQRHGGWGLIPVSPEASLGTEGLGWWWRWARLSLATCMWYGYGSRCEVPWVTWQLRADHLSWSWITVLHEEMGLGREGCWWSWTRPKGCHDFSSSSSSSELPLFSELTTSFTQWNRMFLTWRWEWGWGETFKTWTHSITVSLYNL